MSESKLNTHCAVQSCKTTLFNKGISVTFHPFPTNTEMRSRWLSILKSRCAAIDWTRSRICSRHFEQRCFDAQRKLKDNAIPTMFPSSGIQTQKIKSVKNAETAPAIRTRVDILLNKVPQSKLLDDIKTTIGSMKAPSNFTDYVKDDLQCESNAPADVQQWLLIKKQDHLITRLMQIVLQNKKHVDVLQKNMEESRKDKKDMEQALENYKYIAKCLQEKHATLEEQIEILTAVESR